MSDYDSFGRPQQKQEETSVTARRVESALEPAGVGAWRLGERILLRLPEAPAQHLKVSELVLADGSHRIGLEADEQQLCLTTSDRGEGSEGADPERPALDISQVVGAEALEYEGQRGLAAVAAVRQEIERRQQAWAAEKAAAAEEGPGAVDVALFALDVGTTLATDGSMPPGPLGTGSGPPPPRWAIDVCWQGQPLVASFVEAGPELALYRPQGARKTAIAYQQDVAGRGEVFYQPLPWVLIPDASGGYRCQSAASIRWQSDQETVRRNNRLASMIMLTMGLIMSVIFFSLLSHPQ